MCAVLLVLSGACSSGPARPATATPTTIASTGPLDAALLTQSQLRRVPGFATAVVAALSDIRVFADDEPRGPCGAELDPLPLDDALGAAWQTSSIRAGGQLVLRRPARQLQRYIAARIDDAQPDCPVFETKTARGETQEAKFDVAIPVTRNADQSLAVVTAVQTNGTVRALTTIEIRTGNLLSRVVVVTDVPMPTPTVRGIASLMAKSLSAVS